MREAMLEGIAAMSYASQMHPEWLYALHKIVTARAMTLTASKPKPLIPPEKAELSHMRARRILSTGAFDHRDMERLQSAFDAAWTVIAPSIAATDRDASRTTLATIIVASGNVSGLDDGELAAMALRTFETIREANGFLL